MAMSAWWRRVTWCWRCPIPARTAELLALLPYLRRLNVPVIALTGNAASTLAREATVHLDISVDEEACPLNLAPTASTTALLAMGDAIATALLEARGFTSEDFARSHPAARWAAGCCCASPM